jgi:hypothetical protein
MRPISIGAAVIKQKEALLEIRDDLIEDIEAVENELPLMSNLDGGRPEVSDALLDGVLGDHRTRFGPRTKNRNWTTNSSPRTRD